MNVDAMPAAGPEPAFAAFIGLDWADRKHDWTLQPAAPGEGGARAGQFAQTPEAVEAWVADLRAHYGERPIAVALEQSRGALLYQLMKYPNLVLFPVHPNTVAQYRRGFRPSGAKSDAIDCAVLLDLLVRHRDRLRPLHPDTPQTRQLQFLTEQRRQWVNDRTSLGHRLTAALKLYYPQVLNWFEEITAPIVLDWLERWPTLEKLQRARPATIEQFLIDHGRRDADRIAQQLEEIRCARPAVLDPVVIDSCRLNVQTLVGLLKPLHASIAAYDRQIECVAESHPDYRIVRSFPGAGPALAPRILAALGTQRDRFANAGALQSFTGIAPILQQSGSQRGVRWRIACPKFIRQTIHEWAQHSMKKCEWARIFYQGKRDVGKGHHAAVRALAFKWLRILFRCWRDGVAYDEALYLRKVRDRLLPKSILKAS